MPKISPPVCILMATCNGARFVGAQLQSFVKQSHKNWTLWISDDGSTDETCAIITAFAARHPEREIHLLQGPQKGSAANFLGLLAQLDQPDAFVALADQDDVWMPHRLTRALARLTARRGKPEAYASRTMLTDVALKPLGLSRKHPVGPGFGNALVQNILAGNTLVLNPDAAQLVGKTAAQALAGQGVVHHDWWIYQLMTGVGAVVISDEKQGLFYRQHKTNLMGANRGISGLVSRYKLVRQQEFADWVDRHNAALTRVAPLLTAPNRAMLTQFCEWRGAVGLAGRGRLGQIGIRHQTWAGNLFLTLISGSRHL